MMDSLQQCCDIYLLMTRYLALAVIDAICDIRKAPFYMVYIYVHIITISYMVCEIHKG